MGIKIDSVNNIAFVIQNKEITGGLELILKLHLGADVTWTAVMAVMNVFRPHVLLSSPQVRERKTRLCDGQLFCAPLNPR